jgi:hypothetical protein
MFPVVSRHPVRLGLLVIVTLTFFPRQLNADFIPPYGVPDPGIFIPNNLPNRPSVTPVGTWTLSVDSSLPGAFPYSLIQTRSSQVVINTGIDLHHGPDSLELQFTHPILATGTVSFDYSLSLLATGPAAGWNFAGYLLDGALTKLPAGTGSINVPVNAGDVFGFEAFASVNCILCEPPFNTAGETTLTITNFNAPVPEPTTLALLVCAGGGTLALKVRRNRRERVAASRRS